MDVKHISALSIGTVCVSSAAVFIVLSGLAPATITFWRLGAMTLLFGALAGKSVVTELSALSKRQKISLLIGGFTYGAHFVCFNYGFVLSSYESTVMLLAIQPAVAMALGYLILGERTGTRGLVSTIISAAGLVILVYRDYTFSATHLLGDLIVVLGSVGVVISGIAGRRLRQKLSGRVYIAALSGIGTVVALISMQIFGHEFTKTSAGTQGWVALGFLIVFTTFLGHGSFHWVVKFVPLFFINIVIVLEPLIALLFKFALRDVFPEFQDSALTTSHYIGGAMMLVGVFIAFLPRRLKDLEAPARDAPAENAQTIGNAGPVTKGENS
ncbi:MAG: DMT family transporter [Planctomycetes bacterium]|nr:DMT family transporter [Planctomycetota bacterium]